MQFAVFGAVKLHKDQIPNFDGGFILVIVIIHPFGIVITIFAHEIMNFGVGAAWTGWPHRPKIVFFTKAQNARRLDADFLPQGF